MSEARSEIAFFDVETTVPTRTGQGFALLEFGAILVCPRKLEELEHYSTLIRPSNLSLISSLSVRCNGITRDAVISAPTFRELAARVYDILHGQSDYLLLYFCLCLVCGKMEGKHGCKVLILCHLKLGIGFFK